MEKRNIIKLSLISCLLIENSLIVSEITKIQNFTNYPLNKDLVSQSRGGTLPNSEVIKDGVGTILLKSVTPTTKKYNNSGYNAVLLKYQNKMVDNNKTLEQLMTDNIINVSTDILDDLNDNDLVNPQTNNNTNVSVNCSNAAVGTTVQNSNRVDLFVVGDKGSDSNGIDTYISNHRTAPICTSHVTDMVGTFSISDMNQDLSMW